MQQQFQLCQLPSGKMTKTVAGSSTTQSSSASSCTETLKSPSQSLSLIVRAEKPPAQDSNQNNAASSSQVWQSDVKPNVSAGRLAAAETNQNLDFSPCAVKLAAEGSDIVDVDSEWPNNFQISATSVPHLQKVYSYLRQKIGRNSGDDMNGLDANSLI